MPKTGQKLDTKRKLGTRRKLGTKRQQKLGTRRQEKLGTRRKPKQFRQKYKNQRGGNHLVELVNNLRDLIDVNNPYMTIDRVDIPCIVEGFTYETSYDQKERYFNSKTGPPQDGTFEIYSYIDFSANLINIKLYNENLTTKGDEIIEKIKEGINDPNNITFLGNMQKELSDLMNYIPINDKIIPNERSIWNEYPRLLIYSFLTYRTVKNEMKEISVFDINKKSKDPKTDSYALYKHIQSKPKNLKQINDSLNNLFQIELDYHPKYRDLHIKLKIIKVLIEEIIKKNKNLLSNIWSVSSNLYHFDIILIKPPIQIDDKDNTVLKKMLGCYDDDFFRKKEDVDELFRNVKTYKDTHKQYIINELNKIKNIALDIQTKYTVNIKTLIEYANQHHIIKDHNIAAGLKQLHEYDNNNQTTNTQDLDNIYQLIINTHKHNTICNRVIEDHILPYIKNPLVFTELQNCLKENHHKKLYDYVTNKVEEHNKYIDNTITKMKTERLYAYTLSNINAFLKTLETEVPVIPSEGEEEEEEEEGNVNPGEVVSVEEEP
jgi:hypothetical protein